MTLPACPVCATPHEPDATTCAFCGVSLVEPEPQPQPSPHPLVLTDSEIAAGIAAETDAWIESDSDVEAEIEPRPEGGAPAMGEIVENVARDPAIDAVPGKATESDAADTPVANAVAADIDVESAHAPTRENAETGDIAADPPIAAGAPARTQAPGFARAPTVADRAQLRQHRIEAGIVAALAVLLLVQVVASDFDQLAAGSSTRPWLQRMCNVLRCALPPWREAEALRMLQRDVRADPRRPGFLRVSASFRNDARWTQPWPRLRIILSDADGRAIAARDVAARDYLGATPAADGIASGQVAGVAFDVVDPSPRVTAFTFEFR